MHVGDEVEVTLPETATTGYRWEAQVDPAVLKPVGDTRDARAMPRGAPGSRTLTFAVLRPGQTELRLIKRRPWESEPADEFTVGCEILAREGRDPAD